MRELFLQAVVDSLPGDLEMLLQRGISVGTVFKDYTDERYFLNDPPPHIFSCEAAGLILAATEHGELHWLHPSLLEIIENHSLKVPYGVAPEDIDKIREVTQTAIEKMKGRQNVAEFAMKEIRERQAVLKSDAAIGYIESLAEEIGSDSTAIWQLASIAFGLRRVIEPCSMPRWDAPLMTKIKIDVLRSFAKHGSSPQPSPVEVRSAQIWLSNIFRYGFDENCPEIDVQIMTLVRAVETSTSQITHKDRLVLGLKHNLEGLITRERIIKEIADCLNRDAYLSNHEDWWNHDIIEVIDAANAYIKHHSVPGPSVALAEVLKQAEIEDPDIWIP